MEMDEIRVWMWGFGRMEESESHLRTGENGEERSDEVPLHLLTLLQIHAERLKKHALKRTV